MTVASLLDKLDLLGVQLWAEGGRLRYRAPKGVLTADLREEMLKRRAELLAVLDKKDLRRVSAPPPIRSVPRNRQFPLSFAQWRFWYLSLLEPESPAYNVSLALHLRGSLSSTALERSLNELVMRHEALRATCVIIEAEPKLAIAPEARIQLPTIDLSQLREGRRRGSALKLAQKEAREWFDLSQIPLLRVKLLRLTAHEHVLLFTLTTSRPTDGP